jgi:hypothetical protein
MDVTVVEYATYGTKDLKKLVLNTKLIAEGECVTSSSEFVRWK